MPKRNRSSWDGDHRTNSHPLAHDKLNQRDSPEPQPQQQLLPDQERRIESSSSSEEEAQLLLVDDVDLDAPIESLWPTSDLSFSDDDDQQEDPNIHLDCNNSNHRNNNNNSATASVDDPRPALSFDDFIALSEYLEAAHITAAFRIAPSFDDFSFSPANQSSAHSSPSSSSSTSASCWTSLNSTVPQPPRWHTRELPFIQKVFRDALEAHPEALFRGDGGRDPRNRSGLGAVNRSTYKRPKLQERSIIRHTAAAPASVFIPPGVAGSGFVRSVTQSC